VRADLQSLATRLFLTASVHHRELLLFTEDERDFLADAPLLAVLPGIAHELEVEQIHLDSAAARLQQAIQIDGHVTISDLRRVRRAVSALLSVIDVTARIVDTIAAAFRVAVIEASGVDLSTLNLSEVDMLDGVRWTRAAAHIGDTIWPPGFIVRVLEISEQIAPGVYQVRLGTQEIPIELARA
jgi:hypothetical protein